MRNQTCLTVILLLVFVQFANAQADFQKTDSVSNALYNEAKWAELISFGKTSITAGDDFPNLRLRMAFAAFELENYSLALLHYQQVLTIDRYNQTALYYAYLCNRHLNRPREASYFTKNLDEKPKEGLYIGTTSLTNAGFETAIKSSNYFNRGDAFYNRIFLQLKTSPNFFIDYSIIFYNQKFNIYRLSQAGNHLKLSYIPIKNLSLIGAWNYSNSNYRKAGYELNALSFGLKYSKPYYQLQLDGSITKNGDENTTQNNFQLLTYLSGNLNLYLSNRFSYLHTSNISTNGNLTSFVYNTTIGVKPYSNIWTEFSGTFGKQYNYAEADGLYQYNGFDPTKFKFSANVYYLLKKHLLLGLGYALEKKTDGFIKFDYSQNAINASITWNF